MFAFSAHINLLSYYWWLIFFGLVCWLLVVYYTYKYKPKYITTKALLWLLAIASIVLISTQPLIKNKVEAQKIVLLTTKEAVSKFDLENTGAENIYELNRLETNSQFKKVIDISHLLHQKKQVADLEIIGNGLTIEELENLPNLPLKFPSANENKVSNSYEVSFPEAVFVGEAFAINLSFENDVVFHSYNLDGNADTLLIENDKLELKQKYAIAGTYLFKINLFNEAEVLVDIVVIPIKVNDKQPANILMLNGYPFFEHQHLKEFIGKQGHQLWVRTQTSTDKFRYDYVNTEKQKEINLTPQFLKQIDLLIVDGAGLKTLNNATYKAINKQRKNGMGILLRMDNQYESAQYNWEELQLGVKQIANSKRYKVTINKGVKPVEAEIFPYQNNLPATKLISGEGAGKILSTNKNSYQPFCITNLKNSYLFNLKGDSATYNWLWKTIIDASIPLKYETANVWQLKNELANVEDAYVEIELITNETEPEAYIKTPTEDWLRLSLQQSYLNKELYEATFWPDKSGWYNFKTSLDTIPQQLYVAGEKENKLLRKNKKERLKRQLIQQHQSNTNNSLINQAMVVEKPIPLFWNWLVFIICLSLIWIIEKFL